MNLFFQRIFDTWRIKNTERDTKRKTKFKFFHLSYPLNLFDPKSAKKKEVRIPGESKEKI